MNERGWIARSDRTHFRRSSGQFSSERALRLLVTPRPIHRGRLLRRCWRVGVWDYEVCVSVHEAEECVGLGEWMPLGHWTEEVG